MFNTIARVVGRRPKLIRYAVNAITGGTDAQGEVTVKIEENGKTSVGRASDADIIQASAKAYLNALNRLTKKKEENACARLLFTIVNATTKRIGRQIGRASCRERV